MLCYVMLCYWNLFSEVEYCLSGAGAVAVQIKPINLHL